MAATLVFFLMAPAVFAEVSIEVSSATADDRGKAAIDVVVRSQGELVGGFQNDIIFDHTAVRLDSCRINPAIGTMPLGDTGASTCARDPQIGPCKTLSQSLVDCGGQPLPSGCPAHAPGYSRLRAIVAGTEVFNLLTIPHDSVAYTCVFTVTDASALPVRLFNTNVVASDPRGLRLQASGSDGGICVADAGGQRCAALRPIDAACTMDLECQSGHCGRCCGEPSTSVCAPPRTATPTQVPPPTRTPLPTRTATATRPPTVTPLPGRPGQPCAAFTDCVTGFACNHEEGYVCCSSARCPDGMSCRVPGLEGYCVRFDPGPPREAVIRFDRHSAEPGEVVVTVSVQSNLYPVGGMQNDIIFDNTIVSLDIHDCRIIPSIGLFPLEDSGPSCFDDVSIGPCKNLAGRVTRCGGQPPAAVCPPGADASTSVFRGIVAATAVPNDHPIPSGPVYTCSFRILDSPRIGVAFSYANEVVSDPNGRRLSVTSEAYPLALGQRCSMAPECGSGFCTDGVCCVEAFCGAGQSCAISGEEGRCAERRGASEACNFGSDCQSGSCDLVHGSLFSGYRGACGAPRPPAEVEGECSGDEDCPSRGCVGGFCCGVQSCPDGWHCNTGECAPPAEPGAPCTADEQCALGLCVDGACCVTGACPQGEFCNTAGRAGVCSDPFAPPDHGDDPSVALPTATLPRTGNPTRTSPQGTPVPSPAESFRSSEAGGCNVYSSRLGFGLLWPLAAGAAVAGLRFRRRLLVRASAARPWRA